MIIAIILSTITLHICKKQNPHQMNGIFKKLQLVSAALFSIGHGMNDAQKVMGIIGAALIAAHGMGLEYGISEFSELPN
jgi:PiT family inorganic phosphate transporter